MEQYIPEADKWIQKQKELEEEAARLRSQSVVITKHKRRHFTRKHKYPRKHKGKHTRHHKIPGRKIEF